MWARFRKARDAARPEHPAELEHRLGRVRHVMKGVEAEDAIDAAVGEIDSAAVEHEKFRRRLIANWRQPRVELLPQFERARRDVKRDRRAAKLRQAPGGPARAGAEIEHVQAGSKPEPGHQLRERAEEVGRILWVGERLDRK